MNEEEIKEQLKLQEQITQLESTIKQYLTKEAITRYSNLKTAHQEKAVQLLFLLSQLIQQSQVKEKITDQQLKALLMRLQPQKKDFKIKRL